MKKLSNSGFSIIEVVISAIILSLSVFGIYKLMAENNRIIGNSNNYLDANLLITNSISCIDNLGFDYFKNTGIYNNTGSFHFANNSLTGKCMTGTYNSSYTFTGVKLNNLNYYLYGRITNSGNNFIDWNLGVYNDSVGKVEKTRTLWK